MTDYDECISHLRGRIDSLEVLLADQDILIQNQKALLDENVGEIEDLGPRVRELEQEVSKDYGPDIDDLHDSVSDIIQYIKRRDGVLNLGRYARTHEDVQKV